MLFVIFFWCVWSTTWYCVYCIAIKLSWYFLICYSLHIIIDKVCQCNVGFFLTIPILRDIRSPIVYTMNRWYGINRPEKREIDWKIGLDRFGIIAHDIAMQKRCAMAGQTVCLQQRKPNDRYRRGDRGQVVRMAMACAASCVVRPQSGLVLMR